MQIYNKQSPCFDDILMVPQHSDVSSRKSVDLKTYIGTGVKSIGLNIPIIAAPMDTVCDARMAGAIRNLGGLGIIHRYMSVEHLRNSILEESLPGTAFGVAVGAKGDYLERAYMVAGLGATLILVDTANGHSQYAIDAVVALRRSLGNRIHIMAGNISTYDGFMRLQDAGADSIRVGIGGGSVCTTRIVSGHGMPTLASVIDIRDRLPYGDGASIVADGGIRNSGDAIKALAAGADAVMLGSYLAGTDESPGEIYTDYEGHEYKSFRGMASAAAQYESSGAVSVAEGIATSVEYKGPLAHVLDQFRGGLGSGLSYTGAHTLKELHETSMYISVSQASLGESRPHGKR